MARARTSPDSPRSRSRASGLAGAFGVLIVLAGLVGAGVLFLLSSQRHDRAVDGFARAGVGCTTTLEFTQTGTFYVFAEGGKTPDSDADGCQPVAEAGVPFGFDLRGPATVVPARDESITYDTGDYVGRAHARFDITVPGRYDIAVRGPDAAQRAAIGRDPSAGVGAMQRGAIGVAVAGVVLGGLLLGFASRQARRDADDAAHARAIEAEASRPAWPPAPPRLGGAPVTGAPPAVLEPPAAAMRPIVEPPPLPARTPAAATLPAPVVAPATPAPAPAAAPAAWAPPVVRVAPRASSQAPSWPPAAPAATTMPLPVLPPPTAPPASSTGDGPPVLPPPTGGASQ